MMTQENSFLAPLEESTLETADLQALIDRGRQLRAQAIRDHGTELFGLLTRIFQRAPRGGRAGACAGGPAACGSRHAGA